MNILKTLFLTKSNVVMKKRSTVAKTDSESSMSIEAKKRAAEIIKLNDIRRKLRDAKNG